MRTEKGISRLRSTSAGLFLVASGAIILAGVGFLIYHDTTTWGKDITLILFGSRTSEPISLGIGARAIHYLLTDFALLFFGLSILIIQSAKSMRMEERELETSYSEESLSSPSRLTAKLTIKVLSTGVFPVKLHDLKTTFIVNEVTLSPLPLNEEEYKIPARKNLQLTLTWSVTGYAAETLRSTNEYTIYLMLRGEASCLLYKTLFTCVRRHETVFMLDSEKPLTDPPHEKRGD
jgi:hypothetical protein